MKHAPFRYVELAQPVAAGQVSFLGKFSGRPYGQPLFLWSQQSLETAACLRASLYFLEFDGDLNPPILRLEIPFFCSEAQK